MKSISFTFFFLFIFLLCSNVQSFRIGNILFGGSSDTVNRASEQVQDFDNATVPTYDDTETSAIFNSTYDAEFADLWNKTENSSVPNENIATTVRQSVKKELSDIFHSSSEASVPPAEQDISNSAKSTAVTHSAAELNVTNSDHGEVEEVVLGTTTTKAPETLEEKTIFQKSLEWVENTYTLSILIPVAAGVLFATACICTVAVCGCARRWCRRRRLRKKILLPDSVKSLRASDRKRLLGDCSSDEEF